MMLVDVETAMRHLRVTDTANEEDVEDKVAQASGIVADYCKRDLSGYAVDGTAHDQLPEPIKAATLEATRALFDGDDPLNDTVKALLHRQRDPAMA
jgi:hypothetical protein